MRFLVLFVMIAITASATLAAQDDGSTEVAAVTSDWEVVVKELPAQYVVTVRTTTTPDAIGETLGQLYGEMWQYLAENGMEPSGVPFAIYHSYGEEGVEIEAGLPVDAVLDGTERINSYELTGGKAASIMYSGPYEDMGGVYAQMDRWLSENAMELSASPREIYWTDPMTEPDPANWKTEVIFPL